MDLAGRSVALYGRFSPGARERLAAAIAHAGGRIARDLTRRSDLFVVGALASTLIDNGALEARITAARGRDVPVLGERRFIALAAGETPGPAPTLPLASALAQTRLAPDDVEVLAAFDLVEIANGCCRFGDAAVIRSASELMDKATSRADVVRILQRARDVAPRGRRKIVLTAAGEAALDWGQGLTSLEGQGLLPLDDGHLGVDELFEQAVLAEADGALDDAARLFDQCARADRQDPVSPYNYANIRLAQGAPEDATLAYQRSLARDPDFTEARYNLAQALEAVGKTTAAAAELVQALKTDPTYSDAVFNLAQLRLKAGAMGEAKALYERYLALDPPSDWAATARRAIAYCATQLPA